MIILGLGSNVGDRLENFRQARDAIEKIPGLTVQQVSPIYISDALLPENAPADWDMPYLNMALRCETEMTPHELLKLTKEIEWSIGRKPETRHWGPRIIDIDILAWDDLVIESKDLSVPRDNLQERPFQIWPLADLAPFWKFPLKGPNQGKTAAQITAGFGSRFSGQAPLHTRQIYQRIDTPQLVGALNITPDSFSDGGKFLSPEIALQQVLYLVNSGAEIIDIGAESTAPGANTLTFEKEWARLLPVLTAIQAAQEKFLLPVKISVDTRHSQVAKKALDFGADWINDVTGLQDPAMREIIAPSSADCVVMHHMSIPASSKTHVIPPEQDGVQYVYDWAARQIEILEKSGIDLNRIILDPGIGFGKTPEQSLALLKNVSAFRPLGARLLIGHSRKSFLSQFTPYPAAERDIETLAIVLHLKREDVDYLRVHNVEMCARGLRVVQAF